MTQEELEELLEGGAETQRLDYKGACPWDVVAFAKDILALSNIQYGGHIIIGVEETKDGFIRRGVPPEIITTYKIDVMRDHMAAFADPHTNFTVEFIKDKQNMTYVINKVFQVEGKPVICKKGSKDTNACVIYYRNKNRRIESAPISNSYDLRDLIMLATVRMMQKNSELGFVVEPSVKKHLDEELAGL